MRIERLSPDKRRPNAGDIFEGGLAEADPGDACERPVEDPVLLRE